VDKNILFSNKALSEADSPRSSNIIKNATVNGFCQEGGDYRCGRGFGC
jgi:hypothetical protein